MKTLNVGLIGTKFMGRMHSNAWIKAPLFCNTPIRPILKMVCGAHSGQSLQAFARQWGWQEHTSDWRALVERKDIDILDISAPTYLHHDMAIAAAKVGKHIFCEKPIALSSAQAREMCSAAEEAGAFKGVAIEGRKEPVTVEDAAFMVARFENGALGSFSTSRFATGRKNLNTFEISGENGCLAFNQERMNELEFFPVKDSGHARGFRTILVTETEHPRMEHWWPPGHIIGYEHAFVHAMADFLKAIDKREPIEPNFGDGIRIMEVLEAGIRSSETGRETPVSS